MERKLHWTRKFTVTPFMKNKFFFFFLRKETEWLARRNLWLQQAFSEPWLLLSHLNNTM